MLEEGLIDNDAKTPCFFRFMRPPGFAVHEVRLESLSSIDRTMSLTDSDEIEFVAPIVKPVVSLRALVKVSSKKSSRVPM